MQVLKQNIKDNIVSIATDMFLENGFEKSSIRAIAEKLGMSVGNIYKYFENKEAIFDEIVRVYYLNYKEGLRKFLNHKGEEKFDEQAIRNLSDALYESVRNNHFRFVLLFDKSKGTKYRAFKDEMILALSNHISKGSKIDDNQKIMLKIFSSNFVNGLVEIARNYSDDAGLKKSIEMLATYHLNGMSVFF